MSIERTMRGLALATAVVLLGACTSVPQRTAGTLSPGMSKAFDEAQGAQRGAESPMTVPPDVAKALLPPLDYEAVSHDAVRSERRFDVVANNAPAREVLVGLAEGTGYSIVVHPDVTGALSVDLKSVTVLEALEVLRTVHGYSYQRDGNRIMILGQGLRTQIFPVNYLTMTRRGFSSTSVAAAQLSSSGGSSGGSGSSSNNNSGSNSQDSVGAGVQTTTDSAFWVELKNTLEALVGSEDGRKVIINPQASLAIVRALPRELDLVHDYLGLAQENLNRQVVLEAKVLEVELSDGFQSGINWAKMHESNGERAIISQTGGGTLLNGTASSTIDDTNGLLIGDGTLEVNSFGGIFALAVMDDAFGAFIELLQTQGEVQTLSSPRVSTVNNQKAVIKVGGDEFFITGISNSQNTTGATTTETPEVELQAFFSGIALDVTPQIDENNNIILHIHPTVSEVAQSNKTFVLNDKNFSLPLAASKVQESDNVVRAQSGQVIVIGGLMKEAISDEEASVPLLGDLPLVGNLFKHIKTSRVKKELVILLKPTVMGSDDQWRKASQESRDRMVKMVGSPP